jgi:hypothetical protein
MLKTIAIKAAVVAGVTLLAANPAPAQVVRYGVRLPYYQAVVGQNLYTGTVYARARAYNPVYGTYYRQRAAYNPITGAAYSSGAAYNRTLGTGYSYRYGYPASYGYPWYGGYTYPTYYSYPASYGDLYYGPATDVSGNYLINQQQARLVAEQVRQAQLETRRRAFDEYLYERHNGPTWEDERERLLAEELRRSRNDPPATEVYSGRALNVLLADLRRPHREAADVAVDPVQVNRINFTSARSSANRGLLKDVNRLGWPVLFQDGVYQEARVRLTALARQAVAQAAAHGQADPAILEQMARDVDQLQDQLGDQVMRVYAPEYIEAKQFLNRFEDARKALSQPDVGNYFNGKYTFHGTTAADLVRFLGERGLQVAPAVPGDEAAYSAVYAALAAYDLAVNPGAQAELIRR